MDFLRYNKLLVAIGILLKECFSFNTEITDSRLKRYELYLSEAKNILKKSYDNSIRIVIFKTFTAFPRDVADIDVLLYSHEELTNFEDILRSINYKRRKVGLEQNLWSKKVNNIIVDVEVHTNIAASGFKYYPKRLVFRRAKLVNELMLPSPVDSLLILVAHTTIKDLYLTLSDILDFVLLMSTENLSIESIMNEANSLGLSRPLQLYLKILSLMGENVVTTKESLDRFTLFDYDGIVIRPSLYTVASTYIDLSLAKFRHEPALEVIKQVLTLPRGKGIDALTRFILREKPHVKSLEE
ncbi:MAG: nucleotidyltransferase family protein [Infirmifilum sp.]